MSSISLKKQKPPAVIAGAYQTGVLAVRSLKRRGVNALCFDCKSSFPGFKSVYGAAHLCPDPDLESDAWLRFMVALSQKMDSKAVLIPSSDKFVTAIAKHIDILKDYFVISPGINLQGLLAEKYTQYELAFQHGFPMPYTRFVNSLDEVANFASEAEFPSLIKPNHFREWSKFPKGHPLLDRKISIANNKIELIESYKLASAANPNVILQEIIQGPDSNKRVYLSCYSADGKRIANAMFRELRCAPMGFGPASISEPVVDNETDEVCNRFLKQLGYVGLCEFEMKWDTRDGKVKLIEANPRLSGGGDAAPYAGVDLPWIQYLDLIGEHVFPIGSNGNDFRHIVLRAEGEAIPAYWNAGLIGVRDIVRSYKPPLAFFDLDKRDIRYSLETMYIFFRRLLRGSLKNLFARGVRR